MKGANFHDILTLRAIAIEKGRLFQMIWLLLESNPGKEGRSFFVAEGFLNGICLLFHCINIE